MKLHSIVGGQISTNSYLIIDNNNCLVVDYTPEVLDYLQDKKIEPTILLITHIHYDHIEGLATFTQIYPHCKVMLSEFGKNNINNTHATLNVYTEYSIDSTNFQVIKNDDVIDFNGIAIKVIATPGHSACSVSFYVEEFNAIFCGDVVFFRSIGRTDFPNSNHETLLDSIKNLFSQFSDDSILYPGHGPKTSIGKEKKFNSFLTCFT